MAASEQDRLSKLYSRYLEQIHTKEEELRILRQKIQLIDELTQEAKALDLFPTSGTYYGKMGYTEAIKDAIDKIGGNGGVTATKVAAYILSNGFQQKGKNFGVLVDQTLRRLAQREEIVSEKKDGRRVYKKKPTE